MARMSRLVLLVEVGREFNLAFREGNKILVVHEDSTLVGPGLPRILVEESFELVHSNTANRRRIGTDDAAKKGRRESRSNVNKASLR